MTTDLAPIDVAQHWPYIERHLNLERRDAERRLLGLMARLQVDADGGAVPLGASRLVAAELTPGQASAVRRIVADLDERRVLARFKGRGRRPDAWTFRGDVAHWRPMPWRWSGRAVEHSISACICRARFAVAARVPGQSIALPRDTAQFWISPTDHLQRPGVFLVDSRGNGEPRAATANGRAWQPVDSRGNGAPGRPHTVLLEEVELLQLTEAERERFTRLKAIVEHHAQPNTVWAGTAPEKLLTELAAALSPRQCDQAVKRFDQTAGRTSIPGGAELLRQVAAGLLPERPEALAEA